MANEPQFTGNYGLIILPDKRTVQKAYEIAHATLPDNAEFILSRGLLPHITLYHANLKSLPIFHARQILIKLSINLKGRTLTLNRTAPFKDFFFFWYTSKETAEALQESHEESLSISRFRDTQKQNDDVSKGRILLNSQELFNVEHYGHPWVGDLFCPHITLGYGIDSMRAKELDGSWLMTVEEVVFARIDLPARIGEIISI
jgi:hypothetical protein